MRKLPHKPKRKSRLPLLRFGSAVLVTTAVLFEQDREKSQHQLDRLCQKNRLLSEQLKAQEAELSKQVAVLREQLNEEKAHTAVLSAECASWEEKYHAMEQNLRDSASVSPTSTLPKTVSSPPTETDEPKKSAPSPLPPVKENKLLNPISHPKIEPLPPLSSGEKYALSHLPLLDSFDWAFTDTNVHLLSRSFSPKITLTSSRGWAEYRLDGCFSTLDGLYAPSSPYSSPYPYEGYISVYLDNDLALTLSLDNRHAKKQFFTLSVEKAQVLLIELSCKNPAEAISLIDWTLTAQ